MCRLLLDRGADKNAKDLNGKTPEDVSNDSLKSLFQGLDPSTSQQLIREAESQTLHEEQFDLFDKQKIREQVTSGKATPSTNMYLENKGPISAVEAWNCVVVFSLTFFFGYSRSNVITK